MDMRNRFEAFAGNVIELNRCIQKIKDMEMRRFGLRASHAMCLYYLGRYTEGLTATQLTELCKEDKAAISRSLSQLSAKGLVYSEMPENKRSYRTRNHLTESGRQLVDKMNERIEYALFNGGSGLSDGQRDIFYDAMELILQNLTQYLDREEG